MMLRTTYAGFTRAVDLYFDHLMARVVPLQVRPGSLGALPLSLAPAEAPVSSLKGQTGKAIDSWLRWEMPGAQSQSQQCYWGVGHFPR